jgi:hypothetical protein
MHLYEIGPIDGHAVLVIARTPHEASDLFVTWSAASDRVHPSFTVNDRSLDGLLPEQQNEVRKALAAGLVGIVNLDQDAVWTFSPPMWQPLGDHEASVILANFVIFPQPEPIVIFSTNGTLVTNNPSLAIPASGDVLNREGVMAIEINLGGQPHYGYIHFDFRSNTGGIIGGAGGVIYGWAYETEPNVAIKAKPLSTARNRLRPSRIQIQPSTQPKLSD